MKVATMILAATVWLAGCAGTPVVPPELQDKVDRSVSFLQIKSSPQSYKGRLVVAGGMVLSARPVKEGGTRIEILQLPLDRGDEPKERLTDSGGRFLAFHKEFVDPATIPLGTLMTVVGEVTGVVTLQLNDVDYTYPTFDIKAVTIWPPKPPPYWFRPYPYFGAYWGPYWGSYWVPPPGLTLPVERK
jgi:outer membrane lipoprotein